MARVIRVASLVLLLLGCGPDEAPPPPDPGMDPPPPIEWVKTQPPGWELQIYVPRAWQEGYKVVAEGREIHFGGAEDDGWRPELAFGWVPSDRNLEEWAARKIESFDLNPLYAVYERDRCTIAGMAGEYCVYGYEQKLADGETRAMRALAFYFAGHGSIGFVRGISTARTFNFRYRAVFQEAALRVRYSPQ